MRFIMRNMWRRKGRTFLTIFGIVVGIFVLTVLGAMTARLNQQVNSMKGLIEGKVTVVPSNTGMMNRSGKLLGLANAREIEGVSGVKSASGVINVQLEDGGHGPAQQKLVQGYEVGHANTLLNEVGLTKGRYLQDSDRGKTVLGATLAKDYGAEVGKAVQLKGKEFEVVGILESTLGASDSWAYVPYEDAREMLLAENPFYKETDIAQQIEVFPDKGVDPEVLAATLEKKFAALKIVSPKEAEEQISQMSTIFTAIILGIAFVALFVGGLSIINTMVMSVSERTREIGVKKAIGAKMWTILGEYMVEASMIGLIGGVVGVALGLLAVTMLNRMTMSSSSVSVMAITTTVMVGPVVFATLLAAVAGFFPALRAAKLNPVDALNEE